MPLDVYYTNEGYISRRSMDVDNLLKLPVDFLCNSKYNNEWLYNLSKREAMYYNGFDNLTNLNVDDQYIISITSEKYPHRQDWQLLLSIEVVQLPEG